MKKLSIIILFVLAGCAADPENLNAVAERVASHAAKPIKPLSAFSSFELRPIALSHKIERNAGKTAQAAILNKRMKITLSPLLAKWSSSSGNDNNRRLIVQPELAKLRIVSGGARTFLGVFAGQSYITLNLNLIDGGTNEVIAKPRILKRAGAWAGAYTMGQSDLNLHDYIAYIVRRYLVINY
jgi:hypothetical protein